MAKQMVCDICGIEIVKDNSLFAGVLNIKFPVICVNISVADSYFSGFRDVDLCENCKNELLEWIKGKKEEADNGGTVNT